MADSTTTSLRLTKPTVGGDSGTWGTLVDNNYDYIDEAINQTVTVSIADTNVTLTADGSSSDQARYLRYNFTGALTADRTVTLPANVKVGWASNNTTGGHNVILSAGGATTLTVPGAGWTLFYCDGSNVTLIERGGTATNDSAAAGAVGEYVSASVASGSAVALTNAVQTNVTSISLTAGDWDVDGTVVFGPNATGIAGVAGAVNTSSGSIQAYETGGAFILTASITAGSTLAFPTGTRRLSLASTTTVYLVAYMNFSGGSSTAYGIIRARRVR